MADEAAQAAPQAEVPSTNMVSPQGDLVSVSNDQLQAAMHPVNGYRMATPADVQAYQNTEKYGTPGQMAQTAAEGAVSAATFGAVPGFGKAEDIRGRQEENPGLSVAGGILPYAAEQLIPGAGAAADVGLVGKVAKAFSTVPRAITEAGEAIKNASGLTGVGAKALQYAAEGAIMQGQNEVSKMLLKDPSSSVPNAVANEGMAALLGGALGAASGGIGKAAGLWEAKYGAKAADAAVEKGIPDIASQELKSGIEIPASLKDALSGDQDAYNRTQILQKSDSVGGRMQQADVSKIYDQAQDKTLETLGSDFNAVDKAPDAYKTGEALKNALSEGIKSDQKTYGPIYDELRAQYKNIPVSVDQKAALAGKLTEAMSGAGIGALQGSAEAGAMKNLFNSLDTLTTADGVKALNSAVNNAARNPELSRFAAVASPVIKDFESSAIQSHLGTSDITGGLLEKRKMADAAFKQAMGVMSDIKQAVGLGRFKGTNGFLKALEEKPPEQILQRLSATNRRDLIELLQNKFPEAAETLKNYHINSQLHDALLPGGGLNTKKFLNNLLDGESNPEHIQNLMTGSNPAALSRLGAIRDILNAIPKDGNPSNSASMLDRLWRGKAGALAGAAMGVGGHGSLIGGMLGGGAEKILNEISPFLSYKILEMRGAGKNIVPGNVKALFDYAKSVAEGHSLVNKAVSSIFNGSRALPDSQIPKDSDRKKLDGYVTQIRKDPTLLQNTAKNLQDILPEHTPALSLTASTTANYLNSIKPRAAPGLPLDTKQQPNSAQIGEYNRQLDLAQQPLLGIQHIKDGTLTPTDVKTLEICHPGMCQQLRQRIMTQMTDSQADIPYKIRLGLSLFIGQPLDSTMSASSILAAQPSPSTGGMPPSSAPQQGPKRSMSALNKLPGAYRTQTQTAEEDRSQGRRD